MPTGTATLVSWVLLLAAIVLTGYLVFSYKTGAFDPSLIPQP